MGKSNFAEQIRNKETYIGIEFGYHKDQGGT